MGWVSRETKAKVVNAYRALRAIPYHRPSYHDPTWRAALRSEALERLRACEAQLIAESRR